ncbi:MAG: hypothetical protein IPO31_15840 [Candidatus Obscuribacter sp.]|nr:hypothetical protein [Candidatus Obscuribacter sp.]
MANKFVDLVNGNDANDGSTFANRKKTLTSAAAVAAAGDVIRVMGKNSSSSGTATWTKGSNAVTLSAAMNQALYNDGAWTAAANVTATANTTSPTPKQGSNSSKLVCAAGFTTGKMAHFATGALNLSTYQQVSFWVYSTAALAANTLRLDLCSDAAGNTVVHSFTINVALNANKWTALTFDNGAALGATINAVRLHALISMASKTVLVDNIFAAKAPASADCLTLNTLISPDNATWYHVQNVNGTAVQIDGQQATAAGAAKGFQGTTGSTTFSLLQPTVTAIGTGSTVYNQVFSANGSAVSGITISGGWDSAAMTTQSGWTVIDRLDWTASGVNLTGTTGYVTVDKFAFNHCAIALGLVTTTSKGYGLTNSTVAGAGTSVLSGQPTHGMNVAGSNFLNCAGTSYVFDIPANGNYNTDQVAWSVTNSKIWGATVGGVKVPAFIGSPAVTITGNDASGNTGIGFDIQSPCAFRNNTANSNSAPGVNFQAMADMVAYNVTARGNTTGEVQVNNANVEIYTLDTNTVGGSTVPQIFFPSNTGGKAVVVNWTQYTGVGPLAKLTSLGSPAAGQTANNTVASQKEGGVAANNSIYTDQGVITTTGLVGQPGSGIAWKLSPNASAFASSPLRMNIGKIACPANVPTTIKYYAKFSAAGPTAQLKVFGGRYAGVGSAGTDVVSAAISGTTFAQYSVTFTPTENCVVDVFAEVWGSSTQNLVVSGPVVISQ